MNAGSEYAPAQERGVALSDVNIAYIKDPDNDTITKVREALFSGNTHLDTSNTDEAVKQFIHYGFIIGVTLSEDPSLVGIFGLGQDAYDQTATTISYSRLSSDEKSRGAMTAAGLKVTETLMRKLGIKPRAERKSLRSSSTWSEIKLSIVDNLAHHPIRAYVDSENTASIRMLERMGYRRIRDISDENRTKLQYDLDIDLFDAAIDNFGIN